MTVFGDHVAELQDGGAARQDQRHGSTATRATNERQTPNGQGAWLSNEMPRM
jgi:hypothetical protein